MKNVEVFIEICRENIKIPEYAHIGDAGMDICSAVDISIAPGETVIVPTGLKVAIPVGYEIQVRPRSGISAKNPLRVPNTPGTIDSGYRDEVGIIVSNISEEQYKNEGPFEIGEKGNKKGVYKIKQGDRIAQIVLQRVPSIKFVKVESVAKVGDDRGGGFGSSGI